MRITTSKQIEVNEVTRVVCNKCGKTVVRNMEDDMDRHFFDKTIHNIKLMFGCGSQFDGENWEFDICDECLEEFVKTFKFLPTGYEI